MEKDGKNKLRFQVMILTSVVGLLMLGGYFVYRTHLFDFVAEKTIPPASSAPCPAVADDKVGELTGTEAGCFDYFTYSLNWPAEKCADRLAAGEVLQRDGMCNPYGYFYAKLVPVGLSTSLTPNSQGKSRTIRGCKDKFPTVITGKLDYNNVEQEFVELLKGISGKDFTRHPEQLWKMCGVCTGLKPKAYFNLVYFKLYEKYAYVAAVTNSIGGKISYQKIKEHYGDNDTTVARCRKDKGKQYLMAIDIFISKNNLQPIGRPRNLLVEDECDPKKAIHIRNMDSLYK